jgi:Flp pilus assembly pilin Flp
MRPLSTRNGSRIRIRQRGQGMTEYIIITALIAIAAIAAVTFFGSTVRSQIGAMGQELGGADATSTINHAKGEGNSAATSGVKHKDLSSYQSFKESGGK